MNMLKLLPRGGPSPNISVGRRTMDLAELSCTMRSASSFVREYVPAPDGATADDSSQRPALSGYTRSVERKTNPALCRAAASTRCAVAETLVSNTTEGSTDS